MHHLPRILAAGLIALASMQPAAAAAIESTVASSKAASSVDVEPASSRLELPEYIGVLEYLGERTPRSPHIARSYSYRAVGMSLDIDVYESGASLKKQYERAKADSHAAAPAGSAKLVGENIVQFGVRRRFAAREAVFRLGSPQRESTSYVWLASVQGRLLEMRFSVQEGFEEDGRVSRSEILAELGEAVARPPAPREPSRLVTAVPRLSVSIEWDPTTPEAERGLWMAYLLTRAAHAATESADRNLPPGERQATFEEEVRARTMALGTFRSLKSQGPQPDSAYFRDLDRVEAAGFLREYVWRYLRHESWAATPAGLRLQAFDAWRAAHLGGHVPVTHGRIALRLATN